MRACVVVMLALLGGGCVRTVIVQPLQDVAVRGFVAHAERDWPGTAQQQAQTVDTLDWLAMAIESLATAKRLTIADFAARMEEFRATIKEFAAGDPDAIEQAAVLGRAFVLGAALIDDVSAAAGVEPSNDRASAARRAAESLDGRELPRRQPEAIERYFRAASSLLQRVDRGA